MMSELEWWMALGPVKDEHRIGSSGSNPPHGTRRCSSFLWIRDQAPGSETGTVRFTYVFEAILVLSTRR